MKLETNRGYRCNWMKRPPYGYQEVLGKKHDLDVFAGIVREAGFPSQTETDVLGAIAAKREKVFADFSGMLKGTHFKRIGERVRYNL